MYCSHRVDNDRAKSSRNDSTFQVAASWQANKNFLLKVVLQFVFFSSQYIWIMLGSVVIFTLCCAGKGGACRLFFSFSIQIMVEACLHFQHVRYYYSVLGSSPSVRKSFIMTRTNYIVIYHSGKKNLKLKNTVDHIVFFVCVEFPNFKSSQFV